MSDTPEQVVAANARRLRKALGLSQDRLAAQLAARSGLSPMPVGAIENGRRRITVNDIAVLADALGTTVAGLMSADPDDAAMPARREYDVTLDNGAVVRVACDRAEIDPSGWLCLYYGEELAFTAPGARVVSVLAASNRADHAA
ncbi:helix-turn-helix domain-containing protein [Streptomyces sp. NPDC058001]|uniref:helix-turn-helix domain-containing protein n=1 Tax=Streptomyces sp. NPDC058001 TaxID=3346300 RepID=UPI0036E6E6FA